MSNILPPNSTLLEKAFASAVSLPVCPSPHASLLHPEFCPIDFLPWLAFDYGVKSWNPEWSINVKRAQIKAAPIINRVRGTALAVSETVKAFGGAIVMREWFEKTPKGTPGTVSFILSLSDSDGNAPSAEYLNQVIKAIEAAKPLHVHFDFSLSENFRIAITPVCVARSVNFARIQSIFMPQGGEGLIYLTDDNGAFLTDENGIYLTEPQ